jgi:hypothetical protein
LLVFLAAFFFAGIRSTSLPRKVIGASQRSEQPPLPPGLATGLAGAGEPFLEFAARDAPDPTDPDRRNAFRIRVVHCAEAAQDGRGVNAQAPRHFVGREELV